MPRTYRQGGNQRDSSLKIGSFVLQVGKYRKRRGMKKNEVVWKTIVHIRNDDPRSITCHNPAHSMTSDLSNPSTSLHLRAIPHPILPNLPQILDHGRRVVEARKMSTKVMICTYSRQLIFHTPLSYTHHTYSYTSQGSLPSAPSPPARIPHYT